MDMKSRIMTFRLQIFQRLLYYNNASWMKTAFALLGRAGGMGLDKHLFPMQLQDDDRVDLTSFYKSTLEAWKVFTITRSSDEPAGLWLFEEPVFFNSLLQSRLMSAQSLRSRLIAAGCIKLGHV